MRSRCILGLLFVIPITAAAQTDISGDTESTCLIKPRQVVQLGSPVAGLLNEELVDRGGDVARGQVVARIESSVEQADLALDRLKASNDAAIRAETADLQMAQRMLDRKIFLVQQQEASESTLDEPQTKVREGALRLEQAQMDQRLAALAAVRTQRELDLKQIRSPVDGIVTERKMSIGEFVYEQTPIMTIAQVDPLSVELIVPGIRYGSIKVGMTARVRLAQPVGGEYTAQVDVVDPVIDASSNTFGVRLLLPNPHHQIPAGLRCMVQRIGPPITETGR